MDTSVLEYETSDKYNVYNVVGMGGMNTYKEITMIIYVWTVNRARDSCIISHM